MHVYRRARDWLRSWWLKVPDPRIISIIVATVYGGAFFALGGIGTLTAPPLSITETVPQGDMVMLGVGVLFLAGSIVGMIGGTLDHWELERVGIGAMGAAALLYAYIVITLHLSSSGSRLTQLAMLTAGIGFLALRLAMIWRYDYKPRG